MRFLMEGWSCYSFSSNNDANGSVGIIYQLIVEHCGEHSWVSSICRELVKTLQVAFFFVAVSDQSKLFHAQALNISGSLAELFGNYYG